MKTKKRFYSKVLFYSLVAFIIIFGGSRSFGYEWSKTFGGVNYDLGFEVQQTTDGGFIIVGGTGGLFWDSPNDIYLIKTDANGNELWSKTYGGSEDEDGNSVQQTTDGGFIVAGSTVSFGAGSGDGYLIKTDNNGNELWSKTYGEVAGDWIVKVRQTSDGGYVMIGETNNFGASGSNVWLIKTDADGNELWSKTFGDTGDDNVQNFDQTNDGGFIFAMYEGITTAPDKTSLILTKTDGNGNQMWSKTFGPDKLFLWGSFVHQTTDGGYIISGGNDDFYLIKTDGNGNELWRNTYGGGYWELGREAQQTSDGGYIMVGRTESFGAGSEDAYLIKTNANGNELWRKTYGGIDSDWGRSVKQTADGGYIFTGKTCSFGAGGCDVYLVYYKPEDNVNNHVTFEPDPSTYSFDPDTTDCQTGGVGKFTFDATLTNISEKELSNLFVEIDELTNDNLLLTDNGLIDEGGRFEVPKIDDYADGILSPEENADVPFAVCLKNKKPFRFFVNVLGSLKMAWTDNLLSNPGAETGSLEGWLTDDPEIVIASKEQSSSSGLVVPNSGQWFFNMGSAAVGPSNEVITRILYQDVNVSSHSLKIDNGFAKLRGDTFFQTEDVASLPGADYAKMTIYFLDQFDDEIDKVSTGLIQSPNIIWEQASLQGMLPVGTRKIRLELLGEKHESTYINAFFDDINLQIGYSSE